MRKIIIVRMKKYTRKAAEIELNEIGCQPGDLKDLGGRVPNCMEKKYGTWLRRNDPIAFDVFYHETKREVTGGI